MHFVLNLVDLISKFLITAVSMKVAKLFPFWLALNWLPSEFEYELCICPGIEIPEKI